MKTIIRYGLVTIMTFLLAIQAYGAGAGSVLLLKGKLKIQKEDGYQLLDKPNTRVEITESDRIHTAEGSRAKVFMRGQKETVHLFARSYLTLEKVDDEKSQVSILIGKARFVVEPTTSSLSNLRRKFQIRTSNTFIGIRGTDLVVQTNGIMTDVLTVKGIVAVANLSNLDEVVELLKHQVTRSVRNAIPTPAVIIPATAVEKILTTDEPEAWEGVDFGEEPVESDEESEEKDLSAADEAADAVSKARDQIKDANSNAGVSIDLSVTEE